MYQTIEWETRLQLAKEGVLGQLIDTDHFWLRIRFYRIKVLLVFYAYLCSQNWRIRNSVLKFRVHH